MFSELNELSGRREGGASTRALDDVPSFSANLHRARAGRAVRKDALLASPARSGSAEAALQSHQGWMLPILRQREWLGNQGVPLIGDS